MQDRWALVGRLGSVRKVINRRTSEIIFERLSAVEHKLLLGQRK